VERLLQDRGFAAVVLSDADAVWLRDARPLLDAHPTADVFVSTDCLSHQVHLCSAAVLLFVSKTWSCVRQPTVDGRAPNGGRLCLHRLPVAPGACIEAIQEIWNCVQ